MRAALRRRSTGVGSRHWWPRCECARQESAGGTCRRRMGNTWVVSCPMRWPTLRRLRIRCARAGRARARAGGGAGTKVCASLREPFYRCVCQCGCSQAKVFISTPKTPDRRTHRCKFNTARGPLGPLTTAVLDQPPDRAAKVTLTSPAAPVALTLISATLISHTLGRNLCASRAARPR